MRRKFAKKKRRELLRLGATFGREEYCEGYQKRRKDRCFLAETFFNGWHISSFGTDELEAYDAALDCVKYFAKTGERPDIEEEK